MSYAVFVSAQAFLEGKATEQKQIYTITSIKRTFEYNMTSLPICIKLNVISVKR